MPEPFRPGRLIPLRLALDRGTCALFPFLGADHDPAFGAQRQIGLPLAPPVAVPSALPCQPSPTWGALGSWGSWVSWGSWGSWLLSIEGSSPSLTNDCAALLVLGTTL